MKLRDVLPGQQFYHITNKVVGIRILADNYKLTFSSGNIPYILIDDCTHEDGLPNDEVNV